MSEPIVVITHVSVDQERVCIPRHDEDPYECSRHSHVNGRRTLRVDVTPDCATDAQHVHFLALAGKRCRLVPVEDS